MKIFILLLVFSSNAHAKKIVSTSPALTEIITLLGFEKNIIARTPYCLDANEAALIGTALEFDFERAISLKPDSIFLQENTPTKTSANLKKLNLNYKSFKLVNLEDIFMTTKEIAKFFDKDADEVLRKYQRSGQSRYDGALVMLGGVPGKSIMVAGHDTFYSQILKQHGVKNLNLKDGWPNLKAEKVRSLLGKKTVIIEITTQENNLWSRKDWKLFCPNCHVLTLVSKRAAYPGLRVIEVLSQVLLSRPSHD